MIPQQRWYATEHSTSHGSGAPSNFLPPGFNAEQAKKPLPKETTSKPSDTVSTKTPDSDVAQAAQQTAENVKSIVKKKGELSLDAEAAAKSVAEEPKEAKKLTLSQKIKKELQHYWDGTKLLATEVKISTRLAIKMAAGYELSRREHRQVCSLLGLVIPMNIDSLRCTA